VPEIERKFLVATIPDELPERGVEIRQGYLSTEPTEVRVRSSDGERHELTVKSLGGLTRAEVTVPLASGQFDELWSLAQGVIEKTRRQVDVGGHTAEVDVYGGKLEGLVVVEVEFPSEQEAASFLPPTWFGREVTTDGRFRNAALAATDVPPAPLD
jgi:CYTH domain-containing protein